jgi:hypothetical protein
MTPNISKNKSLVLSRVIENVEFLYNENPDVSLSGVWLGAGYIEKASVKLMAKPKTIELLDGTLHQTGYDFSFEITSLQYYSALEFEKLVNRATTINLSPIKTYIKNVRVNIEVDATPGDKSIIKITGQKFIEKLRDAIDGNPWGSLPEEWAQGATTGTPPKENIPGVSDPEFGYTYTLAVNDPLIEFVTPGSPTASSEITELKLTVVDNYHDPLSEVAKDLILKKLSAGGSTYETVIADDYDLEFENGVYKVHYLSTTALALGDRLFLMYNV